MSEALGSISSDVGGREVKPPLQSGYLAIFPDGRGMKLSTTEGWEVHRVSHPPDSQIFLMYQFSIKIILYFNICPYTQFSYFDIHKFRVEQIKTLTQSFECMACLDEDFRNVLQIPLEEIISHIFFLFLSSFPTSISHSYPKPAKAFCQQRQFRS